MNKRDELLASYPNLRNYAFYLTQNNRREAEDLLQDTIVKMIEKFDSYDDKFSSMIKWGTSIMHNFFIDKKRKAAKYIKTSYISQIERFDYPCSFDTPRDIEVKNKIKIIKEKLNKEDKKYKDVFILRSKGYSYKEIANFLDISEPKVHALIHTMFVKLSKIDINS